MQQVIGVLQSNIIGILLMLITAFSLTKSSHSGMLEDRLFFVLVLSVMSVCFMEIMGTIFIGMTFTGARWLNRFFNAALFAVNPLPAFVWALYVHCKINKSEDRLEKVSKILVIPFAVVVCMSVANLFTDVFFSISRDNIYERAGLFPVATLLSVLYILYVVVIVIGARKRIARGLYVPLLAFMVLPVFGLLMQFFFYGLYMLWVSVAISVIIIFNYVQNDYSITDWLTGLYNRKHLDSYLQQMCKRKRNNLLVGFMMDVDDFKSINDTYGHPVGDQALRDTAAILKKAAGNKPYVARYAGDEFVVVLEMNHKTEITSVIDRMHKAFVDFSMTPERPYRLSLSIGYAIYKGKNEETEDDFLFRMDQAMYEAKNKS